jgi:hypothetical protein
MFLYARDKATAQTSAVAQPRTSTQIQQFTILTQSRQERQENPPFAVFASWRETRIVKY